MAVGTRPSNKKPASRKTAPSKKKRKPPAKGKGRTTTKRPATKTAAGHRYAVTHDIDRPHVRLGVVWFAALVVGLVIGPVALGCLFALVSAIGALQVAKSWRRQRQAPNMLVAGLGGAALPLAAAWGGRALGLALLGAAVASVVAAVLAPSGRPVAADAGMTIRSWLFVGGASASVVLVDGYDLGAGVALIVLMCAYDAGDYVVGAGSRSVVEGPLGGVAAVGVLTFSLYVINLSPFTDGSIALYGLVLAVLAPVGQVVASAALPRGDEIASGLRRFDSVLLAGPAWAAMLAAGVGQ